MFIKSITLADGSELSVYTGEVVSIRTKEKATEIDFRMTRKGNDGREDYIMTVPFVGSAKESIDRMNLKEGSRILFETYLYINTEYGRKAWYSGDIYFPNQYMDDNGITKGLHIVKGYLYLNEYETANGKRLSASIKVKGYEKSDGTVVPDRYMNFQFSNKSEDGKKSQEDIARQLFSTEDNKGVEAVIVTTDANKYTDKNGMERESYYVLSMYPMYAV